MLIETARLAEERPVDNVNWRHLRAEELPTDLPPVLVVTFAQSFHWMAGTASPDHQIASSQEIASAWRHHWGHQLRTRPPSRWRR